MNAHRALLLAASAVLGALALPSSASAATCSDYSNQAAAQRAADTRDGDGDGIYCEDLPCPCLQPGEGGGGSGGGGGDDGREHKPRERAQVIRARITDVTDGDTVKVRAYGARRKHYTVRLIGIDTPETKRPGVPIECGGKQASASMFGLAFTRPRDTDGNGLADHRGGHGRRVTLRTDPTQDLFDRYGRLLAYVTLRHHHVDFGRRQIARGWAEVYVYEHNPFERVRSFRHAQRSAKRHHRGVWHKCGGDFHTPAD